MSSEVPAWVKAEIEKTDWEAEGKKVGRHGEMLQKTARTMADREAARKTWNWGKRNADAVLEKAKRMKEQGYHQEASAFVSGYIEGLLEKPTEQAT